MSKSFEEFSKIILEKYSKTPDECDPYTNFALLMKQTSASVTLDILNEYHKTFIEKKEHLSTFLIFHLKELSVTELIV